MSQDLHRTRSELPEDVWRLIASYLPTYQIFGLLSVNRAFFNVALDNMYREVRWTKRDMTFLHVLHRLQYVHPPHFHFFFLFLVLTGPFQESSHCISCQKAVYSSLVHRLSVEGRGSFEEGIQVISSACRRFGPVLFPAKIAAQSCKTKGRASNYRRRLPL